MPRSGGMPKRIRGRTMNPPVTARRKVRFTPIQALPGLRPFEIAKKTSQMQRPGKQRRQPSRNFRRSNSN